MDSITLLEVDTDRPAQALGGQAAFWCTFDAGWGPARALLVPSEKSPAALVGERVQVRPGYRSIDSVQALPHAENRAARLQPLEGQGCFQAEGQVASLVWLDDEGENSILEVLVGGWTFGFEAPETGAQDLSYGEWVSFVIRELTWYILSD